MRATGIIVVLIILMLYVDPKDLNRFPEASLAIEGKNEILGSCGQGFATSITFSFTCHYGFPFKASLVPTIQVSPKGFKVFLYHCRSDDMFAQSFLWSRPSLIFLWAILHFTLFFTPTINTKGDPTIFPFGYGCKSQGFEASGGFHALKKDQFYFGFHRKSREFRRKKPQ